MATIECKTCEVFYCENCNNRVHSKPQFRKHQLAPLVGSDLIDKLSYYFNEHCGDHPDQKLTLYCTEDLKPVCSHCLLIGKHINHKCDSIRSASDNMKERLKIFNNQLLDKSTLINGYHTKMDDFNKRVKDESRRLQQITVEKIKQLRALLDEKEQYLINDIKDTENEKNFSIESR